MRKALLILLAGTIGAPGCIIYDDTRILEATSLAIATLTFAKTARSFISFASFLNAGAIMRHGPHESL